MVVGTSPLDQEVRAIDWSNDGKLIIAGDWLGNILLFDTNLKLIA